ncbi:MAG: ParB/RepB/Spo0J family partition protein [Gemmatimonadota bacterium]|nr:ParB/RepB/Spo0J family partition protein [Gemmatimonadota bacterium]
MKNKRRLGKGLEALIGEADTSVISRAVVEGIPPRQERDEVPVDKISPNRFQPRRVMDPEAITELAASIEAQGLIQPVVVNDSGDGAYELISGERRLRAVKRLKWKKVPAIVRTVSEPELLEITMVENLQREDLNPIEEAAGYRGLNERFNLTQAEIAGRVGKDRATVANTMRLLRLPEVIRQEVAAGNLSAGHARQLLALEDQADQVALARKVIDQDISVRRLEKIVRQEKNKGRDGNSDSGKNEPPALILELEDRLRKQLGTQVRIRERQKGRGRIEIEFYSYEEFERLMEMFEVPLA